MPQSRGDARASRGGSRQLRRDPWARGPRQESSACRLPASEVANCVPLPERPPPLETLRDTGLNRGGRGRPDCSDPSGRAGLGRASGQVPPTFGRPGARRPPRGPRAGFCGGTACAAPPPRHPPPCGSEPESRPAFPGDAWPEPREPGEPAPAVARRARAGEEGGETLPFYCCFSP